jgi:hypothetical protein
MQREYAYINVGAPNNLTSEAAVKAWLDRVLSASALEPQAKALITTQSLIPVEFSILEEGAEPGSPALIVERQEMPLWKILDKRFTWRASVGKNQSTDSVQVNVLFPKFYGALAQRLTAHRYFLDSLRVSGQAQSVEWEERGLAIATRPLLKTEVVLFSVWGASKRLLADIWFDLPLISLGAGQWPRAIGTGWPGMRIGARSGDLIRYSDEPGKNTLWVKPFNEAVLDADFSIFPRWTPRAVLLADQALKADEVIEVTLSAMPYQADEERYIIEVPASRRAAADWHYYLSVYMSYRCPWVNCGVLQEDGGIRLQSERPNQWFVRCDAARLFIAVSIQPRERTGWKAPTAPPTPEATTTQAWQKWDGLRESVGNNKIAKDYIESLIDRCLKKSGLSQDTQQLFKKERQFKFKYLIGHPTYSPGVSAFVPPRYKYFSFEQVLLGEPQRRAYFQEKLSAVDVQGQALPASQVATLTGMRDVLLADFLADIDALAASDDYQKLFGETCDALARVRVARYLAQVDAADEDLRGCAFRYLKGELKPRLLLFNEAVVPNAIVLKFNSQKALLISLNFTELKWAVWAPSTTAGQPSEVLMRFVAEHSPFPQKMNLVPQDFFPQKKRYGYHYRRFAPEPVSFRDTQHINAQLQLAAIADIKGQVDYAVFSSDEERRRVKLAMFKSVARAVSGLVTAAVGPLSGLGALLLSGMARFIANVGDFGLTYALAQNTDRPEDYAHYIHECKLGVLLAMVDLGADLPSANAKLRILLKQSTLGGRTVAPILNAPLDYDAPIKLKQTSESETFVSTPFWLIDLRQRMEKAFDDRGKGAELKGYLQATATCGYAEAKSCSDFLRSQRWETQAVGVLIFSELGDQRPQTHFALSIRDATDTAMVDFSLGDLDASMNGRGYFGTLKGWEDCVRGLPALEGALVIYKFYPDFANASLEVDGAFALGISWSPFVNGGDYSVLSFPLDFVCGVREQLERVWAQVFHQLPINASLSLNEPATFNQSELLAQVSNLSGLVDEAEGLLRRTIGVQAIGELRALMLGFLQAWRNEPWGGYRELMESVMAEEADLVNQALIHLEALQAGLPSTLASAQNALVDCVDWVAVRAGIDDDAWRLLFKQQLELHVSGEQATVDLYTAAELDALYEQLARGRQRECHHQRSSGYERLTMTSSRALLGIGLGLIRKMAQERQAECCFALIMASQPYDDSNEHFARVVYGICALRQQRFTVLTPLHERRLSGLPPAEPILT